MKPEKSETLRKQAEKALQAQKQAEEALRESEQRLHRFYESGLVGVIYWNMNGTITDANDKFLEMVGYTREELIAGQIDWVNMTPPEYRHLDEYSVAELKATGVNKMPFEKEYIRKDGSRIPIIVAGAMLDEARFNGVAFVLDITERKRAEEALRESEQRWATTLASIGDAVISTDVEGRITFMNSEAEALTGWMLDEASTKPVTEVFNIINEYSRREADNPVTRVLQEGIIVGLANHTILVRKDGTEVPIDDSGAPIRDRGGKIMGVVLVFRDITERKQLESKLKDTSEKYSTLFDTTSDGIWIHNLEGQILEVNDAYCRMSGYTRDEIINMPISKLEAIETPEEIANHIKKVIEAGGHDRFESQHRRKDGSIFDVDITALYLDRDGGRIAIFTRDITERKRAEEALRESEERFRVAQEISPDGFSILRPVRDAQGRVIDFTWVYANATMESITGIEQQTLAGRSLLALFPGHRGSPFLRTYQQVAETGETRTCEALYHGDGILSERWFRVAVLSMGDDIAVLSQDITDRKRAEEALRKAHDELELRVQERTAELEEANKALLESEASYRELTESINDLFFAVDGELRYTYWNKASETLTGILAKDAIGKSLYELFPDIKGTKAERFYIKALKKQQPQHFESQFQIGGKKFIFEINAYPTKTGLSVIAKDITEKKTLEAHLLRAQRMESIGILAGGIAHNLNNMLTPMMMSLGMLKQKFKDEQSQKLLTILEQNSQRSADLVKQVLSFSRGIKGERAPLAAKHLITEIEKVAKETFPRNIEIRTDIQKDLFTISGDATQLHQVIMNLCVNARDAMPDGGTLSISAQNFLLDENCALMHTEAKAGSYAAIAVSDTGTGIPHKILDRIFEPFFTTKEFGKGTGLGLSTSLAIVKSHGGFIDVHSEIGKGTTFTVYLPAIKTEIQKSEEEQLDLPTGHGELVLVAEDEDSIREITISTLEQNGYKVITAADGAEAVALYAQNIDKIKIVLMDIMMPVMDGQISIRAIHRINNEVKIIVVSGLVEKDKLEEITDAKVHAFLPKPYTAERLLKTVHEIISAR